MINYEKREIHENLLEWFLDHPTLHPSRFRAFRVFRSFKITTYDKPIAKHENKKGDYETRETHEKFFCMYAILTKPTPPRFRVFRELRS